ncbi:MAG TPA: hypothetical protein VLA19_29430, partial [Herpetosiphonaceae bacterium]|nr:hypothetical protein [Herpetosiphonaceae bacterium]
MRLEAPTLRFHPRPAVHLLVALLVLAVGLALALLPLKIAAALVAGAFFALVVLAEPAWGLYGAVLSVPVQELVPLPAG